MSVLFGVAGNSDTFTKTVSKASARHRVLFHTFIIFFPLFLLFFICINNFKLICRSVS